MSSRTAQSHSAPAPQRYELWRPVIGSEDRGALERIHQELAAEWSRGPLERGDDGGAVAFEGFGFEDFGRFGKTMRTAQVAFFAIEDTPVAGMLMLGIDLARDLVDARLGAPASAAPVAFSPLEIGLLHQVLNQLAERLAEVYRREGIGKLEVTRVSGQIDDLRLFAPDDCLIVFRFRVGEKGSALRLSIATGLEMIELVKKLAGASRPVPASQAVARIVREIPVRTRVILGSWRLPLREVAVLKRGDSIVLPDGADAWLEAEGTKLGHVKIGIDRWQLTVEAPSGKSSPVR